MARSKGIIKINGTLDGISFFKRNGKELARIASGPDKNKMQNNPNFIRTRENNQEFGGAATAGKALRVGLAQVFKHMSDSQGNARIVKLIKDMLNKHNGVRGQRAIQPHTQANMLLNFSFQEQSSFDSVFIAPFRSEVSAERNEVKITVPDFHTGNMIHAPRGATHIRLVNVVTVLSSFEYNINTKKYEPVDVLNNSKNAFFASDFIPLGDMAGAEITLISTITDLNQLLESSALISCIGIEFYQDISSTMYLLSTGNAMKIQAVY